LHGEIDGGYDKILEWAREAGWLLGNAKASDPHGEWSAWLETNCGFGQRTAQVYMVINDNWDEIQQKRSTAAHLTIRGAVKLIAKPKPETAEQMPDPELQPRSEGTCNQLPDDIVGDSPTFAYCPNCKETREADPDGDCSVCCEPEILDTSSEPVCEPADEETPVDMAEECEAEESAGTRLRQLIEAAIEEWRIEYPDSPACLVGGVLENLAAEQ
jgi:hypothetical protein